MATWKNTDDGLEDDGITGWLYMARYPVVARINALLKVNLQEFTVLFHPW